MNNRNGFTLIELMIVVAIISIIAAIAIPSLLRSRMAANQTSAVGSLDSIVKSNYLFRMNDSNRNGTSDFWVENVWGLHGFQSAGNVDQRNEIRLIPRDLARSDYEGADDDMNVRDIEIKTFPDPGTPVAKSGYYVSFQLGTDEGNNTDTHCDRDYADDDDDDELTNKNQFSAVAFPELYDNTGTKAFLVDETTVLRQIDAKHNELETKFNDGDDSPNANVGDVPLECRPDNNDLDEDWTGVGG